MLFLAAPRLWRQIVSLMSGLASAHADLTAPAQTTPASISMTLLRQLQRKDEEAWDLIFTQWHRRLFGYLYCHLPSKEDAEDVLGETFVAAVKYINHFDGQGAFSTWLYAVAHNKIVDFWRKHHDTDEIPLTLVAAENDIDLDFKLALRRLPRQAQEALVLRYSEGLSVAEIAEVMGRTYKSVESLLSRARVAFRQALIDSGYFLEGGWDG